MLQLGNSLGSRWSVAPVTGNPRQYLDVIAVPREVKIGFWLRN
jgi:hypothetical protein